jgi:predicted transcriptional regulator
MYIYTMERTQIYLSEVEAKILSQLARRTGRTRSQLIREAIEATYVDRRSAKSIEAALVDTAGAWRRSGRETGAAWVERRRGRRLSRLHGGP